MRKTSIGLMVLMGLAAPAAAETVSYNLARVSIDLPDGWHSTQDGDALTLADKHGNVAVSFGVINAGAVKQATAAVRGKLEKTITKLTFGKAENITINGMPAVAVPGDGFMDGVNIDLAVLVVDTPSQDKDLLVVAIGEDAKVAKHKGEVKYIFDHLRPMK